MVYLMALNPMSLFRALPGSIAQGLIWGIMALGVYITFRLLDFAEICFIIHTIFSHFIMLFLMCPNLIDIANVRKQAQSTNRQD